MKSLAVIGEKDSSINYTDRPTVKVVIKKDDHILILNNGLLPGGGIDSKESDAEAINRELLEEIGVAVEKIDELGRVTQYRNYLKKIYLVFGYQATFSRFSGAPTPQDDGEAMFTYTWATKDEALHLIDKVIQEQKAHALDSDESQGRLYNLMTARVIIGASR